MTWIPESCTLPTAEQPLRAAEFDHLLTTCLLAAERTGPTGLRLSLRSDAETAARDLAAKESACCSFFTFAFTRENGQVVMEVTVPEAHHAVIDALAERARADLLPLERA